ncbi:hypothetical protein BH24ACI3_BH24ACI3_09560 [soil metagenome]
MTAEIVSGFFEYTTSLRQAFEPSMLNNTQRLEGIISAQ